MSTKQRMSNLQTDKVSALGEINKWRNTKTNKNTQNENMPNMAKYNKTNMGPFTKCDVYLVSN